jgi:hypothetical protein
MKTVKIRTKYIVVILAGLFIALSSSPQLGIGQVCDYKSVDCTTLAVGCTRRCWTVLCAGTTNNCQVTFSCCYEYTPTVGSCGDCCVYQQGCHRACKYYEPFTLEITGTYGTPSCDGSCGAWWSGQCINRTPYPTGTTGTYYDITDVYCSS